MKKQSVNLGETIAKIIGEDPELKVLKSRFKKRKFIFLILLVFALLFLVFFNNLLSPIISVPVTMMLVLLVLAIYFCFFLYPLSEQIPLVEATIEKEFYSRMMGGDER